MDKLFLFGPYELDPQAGELRKYGTRMRLQEQPMRVLAVLLRHPGIVVTREELRLQLWPADTFVDFDRGLNTAISKLRTVLHDDAVNPRYIETQARRGYRFIAAVTENTVRPLLDAPQPGVRHSNATPAIQPGDPPPAIVGEAAPLPSVLKKGTPLRRSVVALCSLGVLGVALVMLESATPWVNGGAPSSNVPLVTALTTFPGLEYSPAFSPDGEHVAFAWTGPDSSNGYRIYVKRVGEDTAVSVAEPPAGGADGAPVWMPDGRHILFSRRAEAGSGIYLVALEGGPARLLKPTHLSDWPLSRQKFDVAKDGKTLVYTDQPDGAERSALFLLDLENMQSRQLTHPDQGSGDATPAYSPNGTEVAFRREVGSLPQVFVVSVESGETRQVTFNNRAPIEGLAWTGDGEQILTGGDQLRSVGAFDGLGEIVPVPRIPQPAVFPATRGQRLAFVQKSTTANIWSAELAGNPLKLQHARALIVSSRQQAAAAFSPDGSEIAFQSNRSGWWEIWSCRRDGSSCRQLTSLRAPMTGTPRWSPDGRWIAFDSTAAGTSDIYVMSEAQGSPRRLTSGTGNSLVPGWSRDGQWIYFSSDRDGTMNVWRMPATGGEPLQVTHEGGIYPVESPDGKYLYYSKGPHVPTLWRLPLNGGAEEIVPGAPLPDNPSHWAIGGRGIYVIGNESQLLLYDPSTQTVLKVGGEPRLRTDWSMAVSPDERELLWAQIDHDQSDIVLVENFSAPRRR